MRRVYNFLAVSFIGKYGASPCKYFILFQKCSILRILSHPINYIQHHGAYYVYTYILYLISKTMIMNIKIM